jgi:DNA-binding IclR family transcriptional regulator
MTKLTRRQQELLTALRAHDRPQGIAAPDLARILGGSPQGIHQTAASLSRKGLVTKLRHHGWVFVRITPAGTDWLNRRGVACERRPTRPVPGRARHDDCPHETRRTGGGSDNGST